MYVCLKPYCHARYYKKSHSTLMYLEPFFQVPPSIMHKYLQWTCMCECVIIMFCMRTDVRSALLYVSRVHKQKSCLPPVCVIYARPHLPVIPDFPSDIPAVYWNFVYLVSHCVWDLLSTCETRSVPVKGETAQL